MKNNRNKGFTIMELLVGTALVCIIALTGVKLMGVANPEGWETVEVAQVLTGEEGAYALTKEGVAIPIAKDLAGKIKSGKNRVQITKSPEGLSIITGFKSSEGEEISVAPTSAQDQKKSLTQLPPLVTIPAETLIGTLFLLGAVCLAIGLVLALVLAIRVTLRSLRKSGEVAASAVSSPAVEAEVVQAAAPPKPTQAAPPATTPKTAVEAAFQDAEKAA